jgi:hypothetical protein
MPIPKNIFIMVNPPLSFRVPFEASQFHTIGNHHFGAPSAGDNVYNPHYTASMVMVPIQPFMN